MCQKDQEQQLKILTEHLIVVPTVTDYDARNHQAKLQPPNSIKGFERGH